MCVQTWSRKGALFFQISRKRDCDSPNPYHHGAFCNDNGWEPHICTHISYIHTIQDNAIQCRYRYRYNATQCNTHTNSQPGRHAYIHSYHLTNPISCSSHPNHLWSGAKLHASCDTTMTVTIFSRFSCVTKIPNATFFENVGMKLPWSPANDWCNPPARQCAFKHNKKHPSVGVLIPKALQAPSVTSKCPVGSSSNTTSASWCTWTFMEGKISEPLPFTLPCLCSKTINENMMLFSTE